MCDKTERELQDNVAFQDTPASENHEHQDDALQSVDFLGASVSETDRAWANAVDGKLGEEEVKHDSNEGTSKQIVVDHILCIKSGLTTQSQEELVGGAFELDQRVMNESETPSGQARKYEATKTPPLLAEDPDVAVADVSGKARTYTPLTVVPQHQQEQLKTGEAASTFTAAAATAEVQMQHSAGFQTLRYRLPPTSLHLTPPPHILTHQPPFVVHPRRTRTPFPGTANTQFLTRTFAGNKAYVRHVLPPPVPSTSSGSDGIGNPSNSSGGADGIPQATLAGGDLSSSADFVRPGDEASSDLLGVGPLANMGQVQQMVGPLENMPYYMPFNGRENHNEKERKRRNRIKNACQNLRSIVPGLSEKTDKATVFEFAVKYVLHIRRHLGDRHDKSMSQDFMQKYSPY